MTTPDRPSTDRAAGKVRANVARRYPEIGAGGFSRADGTVEFYNRVHSLCRPEHTVLDLGAGRGGQIHDADTPYLANLLTFKGKVQKMVGVDVDPVVKSNPFLDEAQVIEPGERMPFADGTFDLIFADWVLEHVATPDQFAAEVLRILTPGGWFCARTPNRWGMTGIATNLVPSEYHARIVSKLQPSREEFDVFPTCYLLNTKSRIQRHFGPAEWEDYSYTHNAEAPYVQRSRLAFALAETMLKLAPRGLATNLFVFLRKKDD